MVLLFIEEYHAACGPCGTISPLIAGYSYRSHRRKDHINKVNRALQLNDADSVRTRERCQEGWCDSKVGNGDQQSEAYLGQSIKKCTTERGTWQLGQRGGSEHDIRCP